MRRGTLDFVKVIKDRTHVNSVAEREAKIREEKERLAREQAAREAIMHILSEHRDTTDTANKASFSAHKTIIKTKSTIQQNKDLVKFYEEELLSHVQRLA